jgi:gamma-glutamyltranspeptidase
MWKTGIIVATSAEAQENIFFDELFKNTRGRKRQVSQRGRSVFLLTEDVEGDHVNFSVTVLASLGSGHIDDLAGFALDHDEFTLSESRALLWVSKGSSGLSSFEFVIFVIRHGYLLNSIL